MYCRNCGRQMDDHMRYCPNCGASQDSFLNNNDSGSFGWAVLGCCIPIVGLVLYLVWRDTKPKSALMAGKGALAAVILGVLYYILVFMLFMAI